MRIQLVLKFALIAFCALHSLIAAPPLALFAVSGADTMADERIVFSKEAARLLHFIAQDVFPNAPVHFAYIIIREPEVPGITLSVPPTTNRNAFAQKVAQTAFHRYPKANPYTALDDALAHIPLEKYDAYLFLITDSYIRDASTAAAERRTLAALSTHTIPFVVIACMGLPLDAVTRFSKTTRMHNGQTYIARYRYPLLISDRSPGSLLVEGKTAVFAYDAEIDSLWRYMALSNARQMGNRSLDLSDVTLENVGRRIERDYSSIVDPLCPDNSIAYLIKQYFFSRERLRTQ